MQTKEQITGYCPKQDMDFTILVTYVIVDTLQTRFKSPLKYSCSCSKTIYHCTDCPIFNNLI